MKIVLSTIGKFHSFDLARQLHKRSALTSIYSGYPWFKLKGEGLPKGSVKTFPYLHAPYMRFAPNFAPIRLLWEWQDRFWFDQFVARNLPSCDLFCGLSGSGLHTGRVAKSRGAKYICDRGSTHIRVQDRILKDEYDRQGISFPGIDPRIIEREEAEYEEADVITVPSTFAFRSFVDSGVSELKMRLVPYGVDLNAFYSCTPRSKGEFRVLFVGGVTVRKGIHYLLEAFEQVQSGNKHLTLVGSISPEMDTIVASARDCEHITVAGHMRQDRLKEIMSASDVLVLPSVEDGFGLVLAQAMACGCPVIASENTGAQDLFEDGKEGFIVPSYDADAIADRLQRLADDFELRERMSLAAFERVKSLGGWDQYGERMYEVFTESVRS